MSNTKSVKSSASKFETLLVQKDDELTPERIAHAKRKAQRGFDSAIDNLEGQVLDAEETITKIESDIAKGDVKAIISLAEANIELTSTNDLLNSVKESKDGFFKAQA